LASALAGALSFIPPFFLIFIVKPRLRHKKLKQRFIFIEFIRHAFYAEAIKKTPGNR